MLEVVWRVLRDLGACRIPGFRLSESSSSCRIRRLAVPTEFVGTAKCSGRLSMLISSCKESLRRIRPFKECCNSLSQQTCAYKPLKGNLRRYWVRKYGQIFRFQGVRLHRELAKSISHKALKEQVVFATHFRAFTLGPELKWNTTVEGLWCRSKHLALGEVGLHLCGAQRPEHSPLSVGH